MAKNITEIKQSWQTIRNETIENANTATRVGGAGVDLVEYVESQGSGKILWFGTDNELNTTFPNPNDGQQAWVGSPYPGTVWSAADGVWSDTGEVPDIGVDPADIMQSGGYDGTGSDLNNNKSEKGGSPLTMAQMDEKVGRKAEVSSRDTALPILTQTGIQMSASGDMEAQSTVRMVRKWLSAGSYTIKSVITNNTTIYTCIAKLNPDNTLNTMLVEPTGWNANLRQFDIALLEDTYILVTSYNDAKISIVKHDSITNTTFVKSVESDFTSKDDAAVLSDMESINNILGIQSTIKKTYGNIFTSDNDTFVWPIANTAFFNNSPIEENSIIRTISHYTTSLVGTAINAYLFHFEGDKWNIACIIPLRVQKQNFINIHKVFVPAKKGDILGIQAVNGAALIKLNTNASASGNGLYQMNINTGLPNIVPYSNYGGNAEMSLSYTTVPDNTYDMSLLSIVGNILNRMPIATTVHYRGDSILWGFGLTDIYARWSSLLAKKLNAMEENKAVSGMSLCITSGNSNFESIYQNEGQIPEYKIGHYLVLGFGTNDAGLNLVTPENYTTVMQTILNYSITTKGWNPEKILVISGYYYTTYPNGGNAMNQTRAIAIDDANALAASNAGVQHLSLRQYMLDHGGAALLADGLHPNSNGHSIISGKVYDDIFKL